jgi:TorA maturation chaperone TorD
MDLDDDIERAEAYRILADLLMKPQENDHLKTLKEDLELESTESSYEILQDFEDLFRYPGGKLLPLESLYAEKGESVADEVSDFYAAAGLTIDEQFEAVPDHLALEFLFMSYLIGIKRLDLQENFLEEHLMNWVPYYCEQVIGRAKTSFYKEIAGIIISFLDNEYEGFE